MTITGITLNINQPFTAQNGTLTKFGRDTILNTFNQFQDVILSGSVTQAELDAIEATAAAQNSGTVTIHSDVSDAGSGAIITNAERVLVNNSLQAGTPPELSRSGNDIILDDGEGGSSTVSVIPSVSIPFYLENGSLTTIALELGEIPFFLENGSQDNIRVIA